MTISNTAAVAEYIGTGAQQVFPISSGAEGIYFETPDEVEVTIGGAPQTLGLHYTIAGAGSDTGSITMLSAPGSGADVRIRRHTRKTQDLDLTIGGRFNPENIEGALDRLTRQHQDVVQDIDDLAKSDVGDAVASSAAHAQTASSALIAIAAAQIAVQALRDQAQVFRDEALAISGTFNKIDATTDPTASDDGANTSGNGVFGVSSIWINRASDEAFRCLDSTAGAAVWSNTTLDAEDLGKLAFLAGGAAGALPYLNAAGDPVWLAPGVNGAQLTMVSGVPSWSTDTPSLTYKQSGLLPLANGLTNWVHGFVDASSTPLVPRLHGAKAKCKVAEHGYGVGDEVEIAEGIVTPTGTDAGFRYYSTRATSTEIRYISHATLPSVAIATGTAGGNLGLLDATKWDMFLWAMA